MSSKTGGGQEPASPRSPGGAGGGGARPPLTVSPGSKKKKKSANPAKRSTADWELLEKQRFALADTDMYIVDLPPKLLQEWCDKAREFGGQAFDVGVVRPDGKTLEVFDRSELKKYSDTFGKEAPDATVNGADAGERRRSRSPRRGDASSSSSSSTERRLYEFVHHDDRPGRFITNLESVPTDGTAVIKPVARVKQHLSVRPARDAPQSSKQGPRLDGSGPAGVFRSYNQNFNARIRPPREREMRTNKMMQLDDGMALPFRR